MSAAAITTKPGNTESAPVTALFHDNLRNIYQRTDRLFAGLMLFQWLACIIIAIFVSPRTWAGEQSQVHPHIWIAVFLGGAITFLPVYLAATRPGSVLTRHVITVAQMLTSALLIHLTGGQI